MTDDTYNGWTNRETWAMALWLSNEYATATDLEEMAGRATDVHDLATAIAIYFDDLEDFAPDHHRTIRDDVGSIYRVDWHEIAENYWHDFGPDEQANPTDLDPAAMSAFDKIAEWHDSPHIYKN